jgi:hypothetical protein
MILSFFFSISRYLVKCGIISSVCNFMHEMYDELYIDCGKFQEHDVLTAMEIIENVSKYINHALSTANFSHYLHSSFLLCGISHANRQYI